MMRCATHHLQGGPFVFLLKATCFCKVVSLHRKQPRKKHVILDRNTSTLPEDGVWHTETCSSNVVNMIYRGCQKMYTHFKRCYLCITCIHFLAPSVYVIHYICDLVGIFEELNIYTFSGQRAFSPEVAGRCCRVVRFLAEEGRGHKSTFSHSRPHDVINPCG